MQDHLLSRAKRISDPRAAAALADPLRRRIVLLAAQEERAVAELAAGLGVDIKRLHYHVTALVRLRLLTIARVRKRGGRPIKLYRATASAFFVPTEVAGESPSAPLVRQMDRAMTIARRSQDQGVLYDVSDDGKLRMRPVAVSPERSFEAAETWRMLKLSAADAQRLSIDIAHLLEKHANGRGNSWLIHFAVCRS